MGEAKRGKIVDQFIPNKRKGRNEKAKVKLYRFSAEQHLFYLKHIVALCVIIKELAKCPELAEAGEATKKMIVDAEEMAIRIDKEAGEYNGAPGESSEIENLRGTITYLEKQVTAWKNSFERAQAELNALRGIK